MKNLTKKLENLPSVVGILDSGIGGISVLNALGRSGITHAVYVADTAYLPYGQQPYEVLLVRGCFITDFLIKKGITTILIACHTASATILPELERRYPHIIFIDLLLPTVNQALAVTQTKTIGVLATYNTVQSQSYPRLITNSSTEYTVIQQACPLLVPLLEAETLNVSVLENALYEYLTVFANTSSDTLILGCTHYAFLTSYLKKYLDTTYHLVSAASCIEHILAHRPLQKFCVTFFVTGSLELFKIAAGRVHDGNVIEADTIYYSL